VTRKGRRKKMDIKLRTEGNMNIVPPFSEKRGYIV
jgi:hypothetical protein